MTLSASGQSKSRRRVVSGFGALAAVVAFLVGVTSLTDWFERKLDDPAPRPPARIDARILDVSLRSTRAPLDGYLRSIGESLGGLTPRELAEQGLVFAVRVRFTGSVGERFPVRWSLNSAASGLPLRDPLYSQPDLTFVPRGREHSRTWPIWVPYPPRRGRYFLRVTLTDQKHQPVDERDSPRFAVSRIPGPPDAAG